MTMQGGGGNSSYPDVMERRVDEVESQSSLEQIQVMKEAKTIATTSIEGGETSEFLNKILDSKFLENLKKGLHPDEAKDLRENIKKIEGYEENEDLMNVYNYVVSICDAFDVKDKEDNEHRGVKDNENDEHEDVKQEITMNDVLDKRSKDSYDDIINLIECVKIVANDGQVSDSFLSAVKGVLKGNKLSGSFLLKMAEYLKINTKDDDRYGPNRVRRLGKKVFAMDGKGLYVELKKIYNEMIDSKEVKVFKNDPFEKHSLEEVYNFLKIGDWKGEDINKDNEKVMQFCRALSFSNLVFEQKFNEKNKERKDKNADVLDNFSILSLVDKDKITKMDTDGIYKCGDTIFKQDDFLEQLNIANDAIKSSLEASGAIFVGTELEDAISSKKEARFNELKENAHEAPEVLPHQITVENIKETKMRGKNKRVEPIDVVSEINTAIDSIPRIEDSTQKKKITDRIVGVISALEEPGEKSQTGGQPGIEELQKALKAVDQSLIVDGKFGPRTFNAMKDYIKAKTTTSGNPDKQKDPESGGNDDETGGGSVEVETIDYKKEALNLLTDDLVLPGIDLIKNYLEDNNNKGIRCLQLALLPKYKGKIDGEFGPKTFSALKEYINAFKNIRNYDGGLFSFLSGPNNIVSLSKLFPENSFISVCEHTNFGNQYTAYFTDGEVFQYVIKDNKLHGQFSNPGSILSGLGFTINGSSVECFEGSQKVECNEDLLKNNIVLLKLHIENNPNFFNVYT